MGQVVVACRRSVFFSGAAEQLLATGHLPALAQLVGALFPHRHVNLFSAIAAVGEGIAGLLLAGWAPAPPRRGDLLLLLFLTRGWPATVDGSLPVQVRSSPPSAGDDMWMSEEGSRELSIFTKQAEYCRRQVIYRVHSGAFATSCCLILCSY